MLNANETVRGQARRASPVHKPQPLEAFGDPDALLKIQTVSAVTGLSTATIYRRAKVQQFPEPVRLGQRCSRWKAGAVRAWLAAQVPARRVAA